MVEEVEDLKYRLYLPPYMKTHRVFYLVRLNRYVDLPEITYSHGSYVSDHGGDHATSDGAGEGTVSMEHYQLMIEPRPSS